jgi:hypothetical protein
MQVGTPARQPGLRVRPDNVPSRYKAKQSGLDRTLPAAYTGTHQGHTRGTLLSSYDHSTNKSTVSAGPRYRMRTALADPAGPRRQNEPTCLASGLKLTRSQVPVILPMAQGHPEHLQAVVCPEHLDGPGVQQARTPRVPLLAGRRAGARRLI